MIEYWLQIKDLFFNQKSFKLLTNNYCKQTISIKSYISKIKKTNVLEQKISESKNKI